MSFNAEEFFLFQSFQTDDLKAEIETLREDLRNKEAKYHALVRRQDDVLGNLEKMEEKANFVMGQVAQISAMFVPPEESTAEEVSDFLDGPLSSALTMTSGGMVVGGLGILLINGIAPPLIKVISYAPKMSKAAKFAKSAKFVKVAKFAKVTVLLGVALSVVELVIDLVSASAINAQLRKDQDKLTGAINEADAMLREMEADVREGEQIVRDILADAGFAKMEISAAMEAYVAKMNTAIAGLGRQKAVARMVRKMALHGLSVEMIASTSELDAELVQELIDKLAIEQALANGDAPDAIAKRFDVLPKQVHRIAEIVSARGALAAGSSIDELASTTGLAHAMLSNELDENTLRLGPHWAAIEAGTDLEGLVDKVLISKAHLAQLHQEIATKRALVNGIAAADLAQTLGLDGAVITGWETDMTEAKVQLALLTQGGPSTKPENLAASLRLPMAVVT